MEDIKKTIRYSELLEIYQELLTITQKDILVDYFHYDLSIGEIAESRNVSRAAIEDAIRKGIKKLIDYENKLCLLDKKEKILKILEEIKNKENKPKIEEIERLVK